jgi:hypothetical protein
MSFKLYATTLKQFTHVFDSLLPMLVCVWCPLRVLRTEKRPYPTVFFCSVTISKDQIGWKLDPSLRRSVCMCFRCSKLHPRRHHQNEGSCNWPGGLASAGHRFFVVIFEGHLRPYRSQGGLSRYGSDRVDARWTGDQTTPPSGSGASMDICLYALVDIIVWRTADV